MPADGSATCYTFGPFRLDPAEGVLERDGAPIKLPPKGFELLLALVQRPQRLVSKADLLAAVWPGLFVEEGNLTVNMSIVRRALDDPNGEYIETIPRRGYRFVAAVHEVRRPANATPPATLMVPPTMLSAGPREEAARGGGGRLLAACMLVGAAAITLAGTLIMRQRARAAARQLVVVMPFTSLRLADQGYLAIGMAEAIDERLGRLSSVRVVPTAAVAPHEAPFPAARRLDADAVLTGSVEQQGDTLRVTAQLSNARDRRVLFTDQITVHSADIFAVQDSVAERVASSLALSVSNADRAALHSRPRPSGEAYDYYLRAREQWALRTPDAVATAILLFNRAIALDSTFAPAYAGLADAYNITRSGLSARQRYPLAKAAAERALALDERSAEAQTARAFQRYKFEWKWDAAEDGFRLAIKLDPNYALAHHWYAECLFLRGKTARAIEEYRRAIALDPFSTALHYDLARAELRAGDVKGAQATLESGLALNRNDAQLLFGMADVLAAQGQVHASVEMRWRSEVMDGSPAPAQIDSSRIAYEHGGVAGVDALTIVELLPLAERAEPLATTHLAQAYGRAKNRAATLYWLERAIALHEDGALQLRSQPAFDFLNGDPEFRQMLARVGLNRR